MEFTMAERPRNRPLSSLNRALDVLETFTAEVPEWSLGRLSEHLGTAKPTLHRILGNLKARGYVRQDPDTRRYRLGLRAWEVGVVAMGGFDLQRAAKPLLQDLTETTGEQATLWVYDNGDAVCVERAEASQRVRSHTRIGTREPAYLLATGRCLLAYVDEPELDRVCLFVDGTAGRLTSPEALRRTLATVRERRFDVSRGDRWPDVYAVGSPVWDYTGDVVAAMGVSGPATRFDDGTVPFLSEQVRGASEALSRKLGHQAGERDERDGDIPDRSDPGDRSEFAQAAQPQRR
jgi:IclR family transcriptional regulator, KDG regulon repressor